MAAAVAVDQRELAGRFDRQRRFNNRHHRRNAGPGGNRQILGFALGLRLVAEVPLRHHHLQRHTLLDILLGIAGETPTVDSFNRDANFRRRAAATNGVTTTQLFSTEVSFQRQMLARSEGVIITQLVGNGESDGHRIVRFRFDVDHGKRMKCCHRNLKYI